MKSVAFLTGLISLVAAAPSPAVRDQSSSLQLEIELLDNTAVKAVLTNNGDKDLKLLRAGSILDENPLEKSQVFAGNEKVNNIGLQPYLLLSELSDDDFEMIPAGDSIDLEWDIAVNHDLSFGGSFNISSSGYFSYAEADSTEIAGIIPYESNRIEGDVDGTKAAGALRTFQQARSRIQSSCRGSQHDQSRWALGWCRRLALNAEKRARSGSPELMNHIFKSSDSGTRDTVARSFRKIAQECGSPASGVAAWHCNDIRNHCQPQYGAYAFDNNIVPCPSFWSFATNDKQCYANTQAAIALHEVTHLTSILNTDDVCYGRQCVASLSRNEALRNADSWSHFAQYASNGGDCY